jgi:hypothetical protein
MLFEGKEEGRLSVLPYGKKVPPERGGNAGYSGSYIFLKFR